MKNDLEHWLLFLRKVIAAVVYAQRGDGAGVESVKALLDPGFEQEQFDQWADLGVQIWDQLSAQLGADAAEQVLEHVLLELADDARFAAIE